MANATITRNSTNTTAFESDNAGVTYAYANYSLDHALTSATDINVSVSGSTGATAADFVGTTFAYQMGPFNPVGLWTVTSTNGPITLNAGYDSFNLRVQVKEDTLTETGESLTFVVSQTAATVGVINSYWVPAQVDISDPVGKGASAYPRTVLASNTITGVEDATFGASNGTKAQANYTIDGNNSGNYAGAAVKVSVTTGLGGSSTADYTALFYDYNLGGGPQAFTNNDVITIPASATSFSLSASLLSDGLAETGEQLLFTVSQTASSVGLVNSWAVQNIVDLKDPANAGVNVFTRTITPGTVQAGVEGTGTTTPAMATYAMSYGAAGGGYATDVVKVGILTGLGGSSAADYENFEYNVGAGWVLASTTNFLATIPAVSTAQLLLRAQVKTDLIAEASEQLVFTVSQTATGPSLTNSWWVPSTVDLKDASGTGANAIPRTITVKDTVTGVEGVTPARANYNLVDPTSGVHADGVVRVGVVGMGGASAADYVNGNLTTFQYDLNDGTGLHTVNNGGLVTILATATEFSLQIDVQSDVISESSEQLMFTVANTGTGSGIADSWWVPNIVNLQDAQGTGAVALPRTITAGTPTTGMEGSAIPASATFNVLYDPTDTTVVAADYANTQVHVGMYGAGGASAADYETSNLLWHVGTAPGGWSIVPGDGLITIPNTATTFQLAREIKTDSIAETGEGITFTVSQTAASVGLVDSWWVASTADLADVASVYTVLTGGTGADIFSPTAGREMFVISAGKSLAQAGLFDTINGGIATGLTSGDLINVGATIGTVAAFPGIFGSDTALLANIALGTTVASGVLDVGYEAIGSNLYLVINNGSGSAGFFDSSDTLIMIVGAGGYSQTDIEWLVN